MGNGLNYIKRAIALPVLGGAVLFASCGPVARPEPMDEENVVSKQAENMNTVVSKNGKVIQRFSTPLLEEYEFAKEPFEEYRKGIGFSSYDSLEVQEMAVVADYALHWTKRDLWELKGNVVTSGTEGRTLYTQQLFWDRKTKRFYSNVDSKVVEGDDMYIGEGFEADDDFGRWTFRKLKGTISVDTEPVKPAEPEPDSAAVSTAGPVKKAVKEVPANAAAERDAGADEVFPAPDAVIGAAKGAIKDAIKDAPVPRTTESDRKATPELNSDETL